jgi:hypothetical protein
MNHTFRAVYFFFYGFAYFFSKAFLGLTASRIVVQGA